jgi:hypothetical protein
MKKRIVLIIFLVVQIVGLACSWFSHHPYSSGSSFLWGVGFIALLPGNVLGSWLVETLGSHLASSVTDLLTVVAVVAINALVWFVVVAICRKLFGRRSGASASRTTSA